MSVENDGSFLATNVAGSLIKAPFSHLANSLMKAERKPSEKKSGNAAYDGTSIFPENYTFLLSFINIINVSLFPLVCQRKASGKIGNNLSCVFYYCYHLL